MQSTFFCLLIGGLREDKRTLNNNKIDFIITVMPFFKLKIWIKKIKFYNSSKLLPVWLQFFMSNSRIYKKKKIPSFRQSLFQFFFSSTIYFNLNKTGLFVINTSKNWKWRENKTINKQEMIFINQIMIFF